MKDYDMYWQKGGTYVLPVEVFNDLYGELEEEREKVERLFSSLQSSNETNAVLLNRIINALEALDKGNIEGAIKILRDGKSNG